jgi:hypothetical protein
MRWNGSQLELSGILNAGGMKLGPDVNGTNDGLYIGTNNYWYDTGNFKVGTTNNYMEWDGTTLIIKGSVRQTAAGVAEGRALGAWSASFEYLVNDIVSHNGRTWYCKVAHNSGTTPDDEPLVGSNYTTFWGLAADAGTSGTAGGAGPGVVYRGPWTDGVQYFKTSTRTDVVKGSNGQYYIAKSTHTPSGTTTKPITGASYATFWDTFGATFSSVATDILLAQDAAITRGLVLGQDSGTSGFIRSADATSLTTGSAPGFYLNEDGRFRFGNNPDDVHFPVGNKPPFIRWDNATLTIRGKIETDDNFTSKIGDWEVVDGNFQHTSGQIVLDATLKEIKIADASNIPRVFIKQGEVTIPASGTSINISPQPSYDFGGGSTYTSMGSIDIEQETLDTVGVSVTTAGTYVLSSPSFGFDTIYLDSDSNFTGGYASLYVAIECWNNPTRTGTNYLYYTLASDSGIYGPSQTTNSSYNFGTFSVTFPTAGTYYFHTVTTLYGYIPYTATLTVSGELNPNTISPSLQFAQTEIGRDGMIVLTNSTNYASIKRTASAPIIQIATDGNYPGIQITNTNVSATSKAIEVLAGDVLVSGTGNNIMVAGGYIGTQNTAGGIRMQTDGTNSVMIGQNWPSQQANVANARLRLGTKLGISGRELIFDSSTMRIKTDIEDYPDSAYDSIKQLKPILYKPLKVINSNTYETDGEDDYQNSYPMPNAKEYIGKQGGFIAEWLDEDPELRRYVSYGVSGSVVTTDSINYDMLVVPLTKTVQILMGKVEALEAYISSSK